LGYLTIMLLLPVAALLLKASTEKPIDFGKLLPVQSSATYDVTFVTSLIVALINLRAFFAWGFSPVRFPAEAVH